MTKSALATEIDVGVILIDRDRRIRLWNGWMERHARITADEALGRSILDVFPEVDGGRVALAIDEALGAGRASMLTNTLHRRLLPLRHRGSDAALEHTVLVKPYRDGEAPLALVQAFDVSSAASRERRLRAMSKELEAARDAAVAAATAKGEFLANMSHEIRTPLTAVLGFAELLRDGDLDADARHDAVQTILRNGQHLLGLLNDILDLAKVEAGRLRVEAVPLSLHELLGGALDMLRMRASARGNDLVLEEHITHDRVLGDPTRLRQILVNLLGNAVKFTRQGEVRLVAREEIDGDAVALTLDVIDNGIGMEAEHAERIFGTFSQADSSTARRFGGTGLGLTISRRLAELMGGSVELVRTAPGEGSHFRASAKLTVAETQTPPRPADSTPALSGDHLEAARILVADDGADNRRLIRTLLERAGASVQVVENGASAIACVEVDRAFDLIVLDMQMPVMGGYEAASRLRALGVATPIVALTADAMPGTKERCLEAGCTEFATKPLRTHQFLALLDRCIAAATPG